MKTKDLPLTEAQLHTLLHTLGIQKRGGKWSTGGWRNHFSTSPEADSFVECKVLRALGWMAGHTVPSAHGETWIFRVTEAGRAALRLAGWPVDEKEAARRAAGDVR